MSAVASPKWVLHIGSDVVSSLPYNVKSFGCLERRYINAINYNNNYYYLSLVFANTVSLDTPL